MCICKEPTRNDQSSYGFEGRAPSIREGESIVYDECGRCAPQVNGKGGTDFHSHHFRVFKNGGMYRLAVRHGGGDESFTIYAHERTVEILAPMDSDSRYLMLHALYRAWSFGDKTGQRTATERYTTAFLEGRLKKRKQRGQDRVGVWIEPSLNLEEATP